MEGMGRRNRRARLGGRATTNKWGSHVGEGWAWAGAVVTESDVTRRRLLIPGRLELRQERDKASVLINQPCAVHTSMYRREVIARENNGGKRTGKFYYVSNKNS